MWSRACIECELLFGLMIMIVFSWIYRIYSNIMFPFFYLLTLFFAALFEGYLAIYFWAEWFSGHFCHYYYFIFPSAVTFALGCVCACVFVILQVDAAVMNACLQAAAASLNSQSRYYLRLTDSLVLFSSFCLFLVYVSNFICFLFSYNNHGFHCALDFRDTVFCW